MSAPFPEDYARQERERIEWLESLANIRWDPSVDSVCQRPATGTDAIGAACPTCGHSNVLHPSRIGNPTLHECLACRMLVVVYTLEQQVVDGLDPGPT